MALTRDIMKEYHTTIQHMSNVSECIGTKTKISHAPLPHALHKDCHTNDSTLADSLTPIVGDGEYITSPLHLPWDAENILTHSFLEPLTSYTHSAQEQLEAILQTIIENEHEILPFLGLLHKQALSDSRLHDIVRALQGKLKSAITLAGTLSAREIEVLDLAAKGRSNAQIAEYLSVHIITVAKALSRAYRKIKAKNRAEAVHKWIFLRTTIKP